MKKRLLASFLCCLLAVVLPLTSMAQSSATALLQQAKSDGKEIVTSFTLTPGKELSQDATVAMLANKLTLRLLSENDVGGFAIAIDGKDLCSIGLRASKDGLYLKANDEISSDVYFISVEEIQSLLSTLMQSAGADAATAARLKTMMEAAFAGDQAAVEETVEMTAAEFKTEILKALGDETLMNWVGDLMSRVTISEGDFSSEAHDAATTKTEITVTQDDYVALMDTEFMQSLIKESIAAEQQVEKTEDAPTAEEQVAALKDALKQSKISLPITVLTNQDGKLVSLSIADGRMSMKTTTTDESGKEVENEVNVQVVLNADVKTQADGKTFSATMEMGQLDEAEKVTPMMKALLNTQVVEQKSMSVTASIEVVDQGTLAMNGLLDYSGDEKHAYLSFSMAEKETTNEVLFHYHHTVSADAVDGALDLYMNTNPEKLMTIAKDASPLASLHLNIKVADPSGRFDALHSATPEDAKSILTLTNEELNTLMTNAQNVLNQALQSLNQAS